MNTIAPEIEELTTCYHCGEPCAEDMLEFDAKNFCCQGCKVVYELLRENDMCAYYDIDKNPGATFKFSYGGNSRFEYLEDEGIRRKIIEFSNGDIAKATFFLPQIHCASCIWLLENLYKLHEGVVHSQVNFLRKEVSVTFRESDISLRRLVELLVKVGYEPDIRLDTVNRKTKDTSLYSLYLKLGLAGFAFGNIMLFSFPEYLAGVSGLDKNFSNFFGILNIALATPVLLYSSSDYFKSAWYSIREREISLDVPISLGILALYFRSFFDIILGTGAGYMDSFTGLLFFLLIGKLFQKKTFDTLSFERDYKSYFPLSVTILNKGQERTIPVSSLAIADRILIRNGELIPADSVLQSSSARVDYSFVTGESEPVEMAQGALVYAGGRIVGQGAEMEVVKEVSQSYLTRLWNNDVFTKEKHSSLIDISNAFGKYFTIIVMIVAVAAALYWLPNVGLALQVFTAVLIIACPCAITLASPFALGTAITLFGKAGFYLKNIGVLPDLAKVNTIIFDKTGTLTRSESADIRFDGGTLAADEVAMLASALKNSTHPLSRKIFASLAHKGGLTLDSYEETANKGVQCTVAGHSIVFGSRAWLLTNGTQSVPEQESAVNASVVYVAFDNHFRGFFEVRSAYRNGLEQLFDILRRSSELFLLSGDNDKEKQVLLPLFKDANRLFFHQSPEDKLRFVEKLKAEGKQTAMIGDGLNDAGALRQSHVGISLTEDAGAFSPACDAILSAEKLERLPDYIAFAQFAMKTVFRAFLISVLYNLAGLSLAVIGLLSPLVTAIFMPVSSLTIIVFTTVSMNLKARSMKL